MSNTFERIRKVFISNKDYFIICSLTEEDFFILINMIINFKYSLNSNIFPPLQLKILYLIN